MIVSRCCSEKVEVESSNEGGSYYVCEKCFKACDTRTVIAPFMEDEDGGFFRGGDLFTK